MADQTVTTSKFLSLSIPDYLKGLLMAVLSAVLTSIYSAIQSGGISSIKWGEVLTVGVTALVAYLIKNFFTPAQTIVTPPVTTPGTQQANVTVTPPKNQ